MQKDENLLLVRFIEKLENYMKIFYNGKWRQEMMIEPHILTKEFQSNGYSLIELSSYSDLNKRLANFALSAPEAIMSKLFCYAMFQKRESRIELLSLLDIPNDNLQGIFYFLPVKSILQVSQVSKKLRNLVRNFPRYWSEVSLSQLSQAGLVRLGTIYGDEIRNLTIDAPLKVLP
jgi:hypothetical protein